MSMQALSECLIPRPYPITYVVTYPLFHANSRVYTPWLRFNTPDWCLSHLMCGSYHIIPRYQTHPGKHTGCVQECFLRIFASFRRPRARFVKQNEKTLCVLPAACWLAASHQPAGRRSWVGPADASGAAAAMVLPLCTLRSVTLRLCFVACISCYAMLCYAMPYHTMLHYLSSPCLTSPNITSHHMCIVS